MFNRNNVIYLILRSFYCWIILLSSPDFETTCLRADTGSQKPESRVEKARSNPATKTSMSLASIKDSFLAHDADENGQLSRSEFLKSFPEQNQPVAQRDFKLFNRDGDQALSFEAPFSGSLHE